MCANFQSKWTTFNFSAKIWGNCTIRCNILVQILLRVLQRARWRLKWAGWRLVELDGGSKKLGGGGWSWVELGGGGWGWVELGARFSNTCKVLSFSVTLKPSCLICSFFSAAGIQPHWKKVFFDFHISEWSKPDQIRTPEPNMIFNVNFGLEIKY